MTDLSHLSHPSRYAYEKRGCRCELCVEWKRAKNSKRSKNPRPAKNMRGVTPLSGRTKEAQRPGRPPGFVDLDEALYTGRDPNQ